MANMTLNSFGISNGNTVETLTSLDGKLVLSSDMGTAISFTKVAPTFVDTKGQVFTAVGKADGTYLVSGKLIFKNTVSETIKNEMINFECVVEVASSLITGFDSISSVTTSEVASIDKGTGGTTAIIEITSAKLTSVIAYSCSVIKL